MSLKVYFSLVTFCICLPLLIAPALPAQESMVNDLFVDYERVLQIQGQLPFHTVSKKPYRQEYISRIDTVSNHPWADIYRPERSLITKDHLNVFLYDPEQRTYWRNLEPGGINDGAVWQGRGITSSFTSGFYFRYRFLSASVRPIVIYNQNRDFLLSPYTIHESRNSNKRSEYSYPLGNMDWPQKFGDKPFWTFDPGASYIKIDFLGYETGISNQQRWWGPAQHYPIIMSNNSPGYWHFFIGTDEPENIYIGNLETTFLWGKLMESNYFDEQSFNDERYLTGFTASFNPKPVPNLTIGFSRVFMRNLPPEGLPVRDLFAVFGSLVKSRSVSDRDPAGNDTFDQMLSLYGRWAFPKSGFEIYGEWVRNDHSWNLRDALGEPEHSRGYMVGLQKSYVLPDRNILALNAEIVQLETTKTSIVRSRGSFYTHHIVQQGYTQRGQILGAGTGPGSNSQIMEGKYYFKTGRLSCWFRRTLYNNDFLYQSSKMLNQPENIGLNKYWLHNFEIGGGSSLTLFLDRWETEVGLEITREYNDDYLYENDQFHLVVNLGFRYHLSSLR